MESSLSHRRGFAGKKFRSPMSIASLTRKVGFASLIITVGFAVGPWAHSQIRLPLPALEAPAVRLPTPDLPLVGPVSLPLEYLRRGQELEKEGRWADAVVFYEEALRRYPRDRELFQRYQHSRLRADVARRLRDASYLSLLEYSRLPQATEALHETVLKIQVHYVEPISWSQLVQATLREAGYSLSEPRYWTRSGRAFSAEKWTAVVTQWEQLARVRAPADRFQATAVFAEAARLAESRTGLPAETVLIEFICTLSNLLDIYSCYLTPQQLKEILSQIEGNFVGLGVELKGEDGALSIVRVIPGSPAEAAGLRPGDRITAVGEKLLADLPVETAADLLQGPEGSLVCITVVSPGQPPRQLWVRRAHVDVPSVEGARIVDPEAGVGYLRITAFQKTTPKELDAALWSLFYQGMRSVVVDLRGNPGGLLGSAVEAADRFLERGVIVYTRGRNVVEDCTYVAHEAGTWRMPLVVMIDGQSASAAEIFAAAIRDHRRGTLVGTPSYGKGSVQGIFPLNAQRGGLRLTTSRFYSPAGHPFTLEGVVPDVLLHQAARPISFGADQQSTSEDYALSVAIQKARELTTSGPQHAAKESPAQAGQTVR